MTPTPRLPTAYNLIRLETVDSTNAEARRLAVQGEDAAPDGTLIWALEQTQGKGRRGREWVSPRGNFYGSLVLRPEVPIAQAAELGFVAGIAVFDTIGEVADPGYETHLKWPNDILMFKKKVGRLLLEAEPGGPDGQPTFVILGLGVNLMHYPKDTDFPATSFVEEGLVVPDVTFLEAFARHFLDRVTRWVEGGFAAVAEDWRWRAAGIGEPITVRLENETLEGTFKDIDDATGALILDRGDAGTRTIAAGDVYFGSGAG